MSKLEIAMSVGWQVRFKIGNRRKMGGQESRKRQGLASCGNQMM